MLALTLATILASTGAEASHRGDCPYGDIAFVSSQAKADATVRFVRTQAAADCVVRWTSVAPGPGYWREVSSFPDFRLFVTTGIADFTVFTE